MKIRILKYRNFQMKSWNIKIQSKERRCKSRVWAVKAGCTCNLTFYIQYIICNIIRKLEYWFNSIERRCKAVYGPWRQAALLILDINIQYIVEYQNIKILKFWNIRILNYWNPIEEKGAKAVYGPWRQAALVIWRFMPS